ncbi:hypothetical protein A4D02_21065 [Niastella koreensis]|uniref:SbsA Ig-like domain-containing protein n=1 Tax=Niastella koreensis TaxID=354356 RepID=A0ABX3P3E4_9BACT|nr:Ig-like domain-containing protein [Niastella koreensis]OQP54170.1 hypothetical protein A4D02_21065 [Niastella koreensis]
MLSKKSLIHRAYLWVTKNAGAITIVRASDNTVIETINVASGQVTGTGVAYTIDPPVTLASNTTYSVSITTGAFPDLTSTEFPGISGSTFSAHKQKSSPSLRKSF